MDEREERIGRNEILFREVNERLRAVNESFALVTDKFEIVCECGRIGCDERIPMTTADYEGVRADSLHFAVVPGHEVADIESVVERREGYDVVRKRPGGPAELAAAEDPRS